MHGTDVVCTKSQPTDDGDDHDNDDAVNIDIRTTKMMIVPAPGPPNSEFCFTAGLEKMKETKQTKRDLIRRRSLRSEATAKPRKNDEEDEARP